ncbi:MAG TPA: NlpC/P60 family protein [Clostridia bacterium]|nr:NlpC/P60 family protein [Clostridia bacterium]
MSKNNIDFVEHIKAQIGSPYWYGTFGVKTTESLWRQKKKQYPSHYSDNRYKIAKANHFGKRAYDCSGLIKSYMFMKKPTSSPKYSVKYDKNVGGILAACTKTGSISTIPETVGLLVFRGKAHVGVCIGDSYVVEAKGFNEGVVKTRLKDGGWDKWGQLGWIEYKSPTPVAGAIEDTVKHDVFKNTSGDNLIVYADTARLVKIGTLFKNATCNTLGIKNNLAVILYRINGTSSYKVGFTQYIKGIQK